MQLKRKVVHQLLLSDREVGLLIKMLDDARAGKMVHAAEVETAPGQFFGVVINEEHDSQKLAEKQRAMRTGSNWTPSGDYAASNGPKGQKGWEQI